MADDDRRPAKRVRIDSSSPPAFPFSSQSTLTPPPTSEPSSSPAKLKPLPPHILLLSLPSLLALPPNHRNYVQSLVLSLTALRKCLTLPALSSEIECRAWCGLAEIGMRVISGGLSEDESYAWATGIEAEVDKAISKASIIAQKHPSLRSHKVHLSLLQAQLSQWQHKTKYARTQLRNLISTFQPSDPPHVVYSAHLAIISLLTAPIPPAAASSSTNNTHASSSPAYTHKPQDIGAALSAVQDLEALSLKYGHARMTILSHVLRLRILTAAGMWRQVADAILRVESALGLSYEAATATRPRQPDTSLQELQPPAQEKEKEDNATFIFFEDPFEVAMAIHALILIVVYYTHIGSAAETSSRLSHLHAVMDSGALEKFPDGTVEAKLGDSPPLLLQVTHPRILYLLTFLVSCVAKRDAVGRKPKRKVFATAGVAAWDDGFAAELTLPLWSSRGDVDEIEQRLARIKADLLCESVAVSIMRSEFEAAEQNLNSLIAHTRTYSIFPNFAARVALHHAHLAHSLDQTARALACYRVAARVGEHDQFVRLSARAGEIILLLSLQGAAQDGGEQDVDRKEAMAIAQSCRGCGGTLEAVGEIIEALLSPEVLRSKEHLKQSLAVVTKAQDNYLRAIVLALVAAHYFHTAGDHAFKVLQTCEQLAAGLGAPPTRTSQSEDSPAVGHARLGLWIGQRFFELYKRANKEDRAQRQAAVNAKLEAAVSALTGRNDAGDRDGTQ